MYTLYILISNMIINIFLLTLTAAILRLDVKKLRIPAAALIGALYTIGDMYFIEFGYWPLKVVLFLGMVLTAFQFGTFLFYIKKCAIFLLSTVILGGAVGLVSRGNIHIGVSVAVHIVILLLLPILPRFIRKFHSSMLKSRTLRALEIDYMGEHIKVKAFADTGNMLSEPVSGLPVIVVEEQMLKVISDYSSQAPGRISVLPYKTISDQNGALVAFKADNVRIDGKRVECFIGVYDGKLSDTGEFHAIMNPLLVM